MEDTAAHQLGRHAEAIETLKDDMKLMRESMQRVELLLAQQTGGWKVIAVMLTAAGSLGAAFTWVVTHVKFGGP